MTTIAPIRHSEPVEESASLPTGWTNGPIEDLFAPLEDGRTLHQGWSPQCEKALSPSEEVWGVLKTTSIQAGEFQPEHNKQLPGKLEPRPLIEVKEGDILITCAGPRARCGVACLVRRTRKRLMMSGKMYRFRVDPKHHDVRYVEAFLQTEQARQAIDKMKTGGSDSGLNLTHDRFRQLLVPVAPLPEQRRIVAEIEKQFTRLEAGGAALRRVQANLHRYRAAVLKTTYERDWPRQKIADVASLVTKGSSPNWQGFDYCDDGIAFVRSQNVGWGFLDLSDVAHLPVAFNAKEKKSVLKAGDVLLNIVGASIGRSAVATGDIEGGNVNQAVAVIRLKPEAMLPRFLMFYLVSPATQVRIHSEKVDVARANFSLEDIRQLPVPMPPLAEQERIVAEVERRLSVVEELSALVTANLQRATRLRQSILQQAFEGKLTSTAPS